MRIAACLLAVLGAAVVGAAQAPIQWSAERNIRAKFAGFKSACAAPTGADPVRDMIAQANRELLEEQHRYDRETGHGVNARAQDQWKRRIRAMLN